jgi:competence ComEA-like helix-hairpin-helix protein
VITRIKNYLSVTKKEWNGMVMLVILIALVLAAPFVLQSFRKDNAIDGKEFDKAVATLEKTSPIVNDTKTNAYKKTAPGVVIELNTADSAKLTELTGIGPSFARRIISYREHLGGFYKKEQLKEVFGLDSEKYAGLQAQVIVDASLIRKIKINKVNFDGLKRFPYLSFKQMNAIIQFREQHGDYQSIDDMRNIAILNEEILKKIKPYISFK